ncbi:HAD family phosphatase [Sphingobacterium sp. N143]|uniref:HAD family hydrolase n=1 Tax=Sphingobacterium sp. N143 TaxID=2746727 RepID=UPI0025755DBE|nr:HAD family phosphatase [Sphingobacterium sp. N143]MDM1293674.1 HAD family phosphatase [Sphingobacterium sp. N143]
MNKIQAVLFDLDGTLIDSEYFYFKNWAPILKEEFDLEITYEDWIRDFAGHTTAHNVERLIDDYGFDTTQEYMWKRTRAAYADSNMSDIQLMPGAQEILAYLKENHIRIGLVTSSYRSTVDTVLGKHGLLDYFEFFVTRECVESPKPNPEPYRLALKNLGLPAISCVAIEDTLTGSTAALGAGLQLIAVTKQEVERARLTAVDNIVENLWAVKALLSQWNEVSRVI